MTTIVTVTAVNSDVVVETITYGPRNSVKDIKSDVVSKGETREFTTWKGNYLRVVEPEFDVSTPCPFSARGQSTGAPH